MHWVRRSFLLAFVAALLVAAHFFVKRNEQTVNLDFVWIGVETVELWVVLLSAFGSGLVLASGVAVFRGARLRLETRRYRKVARDLEVEVHELRNLPLAPHAVEPGEADAHADPLGGLERGG